MKLCSRKIRESKLDLQLYLKLFSRKIREIKFCNFSLNWFHEKIRENKLDNFTQLCCNIKNLLSQKIFRQINHLVFSLVKAFTNFCQKSVRDTVLYLKLYSRKNREIKSCNFSWIWFQGKIRENKLNNFFEVGLT